MTIDRTVRNPRALIVATAAGALVGFAGAFTGARLVKTGTLHLAGWSDALALVLALFFVATGLAFAIGGRSGVQAAYLRQQCAVSLLAGTLLVVPVVTAGDDTVRRAVYAAILCGFALQSMLNVAIWRRSDEFLRAVLAEATFAVFWIAQGVLFLIAAAAKVGLVPMPTLWDGVTLLMAIYAVTSVVVGMRRGMG